MSTLRRHTGFSLIELMVTLAVLAIIVATAAPSFQSFLDKNRVVGAAEAVYTQAQAARSEAVKQSADMVLVVSSGASWCVGFSRNTGTPCDCTAAIDDEDACSVIADGTNSVLKVVDGSAFNGVTVGAGAPASMTFSGVRGATTGAGSIQLQSALGRQMQVQVNAIGRVRLCSPSASVGGYPSC